MGQSLRIALGLFVFCLIGFFFSGQIFFLRLSYLWFFLIAANFLVARTALIPINLRRKARVQRAQVGDIFEETFEVSNAGRLPRVWVELQDYSGLPGAKVSRVLSLVGGRRTRSFVTRTRLAQRGVYPLGPTRLVSGDPFGFFSFERAFPVEQTLTVYPPVVPIATVENPWGLMPGGEAIRRRTHQVTPNASTVRDYAVGDPFSRIHWRSTARRQRLIVKEFELDPLAEIWILLDAEAQAQAMLPFVRETDAGSVLLRKDVEDILPPASEEYGVCLAASLAQYFLAQGRSLGLVAAQRNFVHLSADRGDRQLNKIMETLAVLRANGSLPFAGFVSSQVFHILRGSLVILITPSVDLQLVAQVDQMRRQGLRPLVLLLDAASFGGQIGSKELSRSCAALGVPSLLISEGQNLELALQALGPRRAMPMHFAALHE